MAARLSIRRLRLATLTPHDHPSPSALAGRLADAARAGLTEALEAQLQSRTAGRVLRIRRLKLDITLDAGADDAAFVTHLAGAIAEELRRVEAPEGADTNHDNVVVFATPATHLAAVIESLAAGRATECWWLRDAEGLRFLKPAVAIRTALLAEPLLGQAALKSLKPQRLAALVATLGQREAARVLDAFAAAAAVSASPESSADAIVEAAAQNPELSSPLALYLSACVDANLAGPALAAAAEMYAATLAETQGHATPPSVHNILDLASARPKAAPQPLAALPEAATSAFAQRVGPSETGALSETVARALTDVLAKRRIGPAPKTRTGLEPQFSRFAGLLLLVPGLEASALAAQTAAWPNAAPDTAALIAFAALGLCAGRKNFPSWLRDPTWRVLFGLDPRMDAATLAERLGAVSPPQWQSIELLGHLPATLRETKFLLLPGTLLNPERRAARRALLTLAALANAIGARFTRRLCGLRAASAPFLWENLLSAGGVFEQRADGWDVRLARPPLDVLLSLSRMTEGSINLPAGSVRLTRVAP